MASKARPRKRRRVVFPDITWLQLYSALYYTGFPRDSWVMAAAIVQAESGRRLRAVNRNKHKNGSTSWDLGPWQINSRHRVTWLEATDLMTATRFAFKLSKGGRYWRPWMVTRPKHRASFRKAIEMARRALLALEVQR